MEQDIVKALKEEITELEVLEKYVKREWNSQGAEQ